MCSPSEIRVPDPSNFTQRHPYWREAATVMLTVRDCESQERRQDTHHKKQSQIPLCDYSLLMLRRTLNASFMANSLVFPGGVISTCDISDRWTNHFVNVTGKPFGDVVHSLRVNGDRPPMMRNSHDWSIPPEVAFRICGIRETFEESGVLLARGRNEFQRDEETFRPFCGNVYNNLPIEKLKEYRKLVHKDDSKFLEMCMDLDIVPDIWSLTEWSNILTPALPHTSGLSKPPRKPYRFDTVFYTCCVEEKPQVIHDEGEIVAFKWLNPSDLMSTNSALRSSLPLPQIWELSKIINMSSFRDLVDFTRTRERYGIQQMLIVFVVCSDGVIELLPGDDLYPSLLDAQGRYPLSRLDKPHQQLLESCQHVNRMFIPSGTSTRQMHYRNVALTNGHLTPRFMKNMTMTVISSL